MAHIPQILVVGSFVMDLITSTQQFPSEGQTVLGCDFQMAPGGKGANQAVQAARLGARVTMVGKVGDDLFGRRLLASSSEAGIDIGEVRRDSGVPSAVGNVIIERCGVAAANRIIVVPGANMAIRPEDVAFLEQDIAHYDMVILQLEIPMEINILVARYASTKGVPVMLNAAPSDELPQELLQNITYISPNEHEAADITGISIDCGSGEALEKRARAAAAKLMEMGVDHVLITLGARGAAFGDREEFLLCPAREDVTVVDPTAAGDSFVAAFCTAVCCGAAHGRAVEFANDVAAITVSRMGAQPSLPTIGEVAAGWNGEEQVNFRQIYAVLQEGKTA